MNLNYHRVNDYFYREIKANKAMKGVSIINDETQDKRYVQIELSTLRKARQQGKSIVAFLEDLEDIIDVELSKGEKGTSWKEAKEQLRREQIVK